MSRNKVFEATDDKLSDPRIMELSDFGEPQAIETICHEDAMKAIELEAFMQEELVIRLPRSPIKGTLAIELPSVNGRNMPIVRGQKTRLKRLYVEALAQSVAFDYEQRQANPSDLSEIENVEIKTLAYPFEVLEDPSGEKGHAWLERIMLAQ